MLQLLAPDLIPANVFSGSFGDALSRVTAGYNAINGKLKDPGTSAAKRLRLANYLTGTLLPGALVLFQPDDMAVVIAYAQGLKEAAIAQADDNSDQ